MARMEATCRHEHTQREDKLATAASVSALAVPAWESVSNVVVDDDWDSYSPDRVSAGNGRGFSLATSSTWAPQWSAWHPVPPSRFSLKSDTPERGGAWGRDRGKGRVREKWGVGPLNECVSAFDMPPGKRSAEIPFLGK
jgi:hypothetical protein